MVIGTIQRIYSMLKGEQEPAPDLDDLPIEAAETLFKKPLPVEYNPDFPIEEFDFIVTDECHRSIYNLWRQVLDYFDASIIGLTATPSKQTFGFFKQNLVMEYNHEKAVADGVNVGCDIYRINTAITQAGGKVEAGFYVDKRDRQTRQVRWEQLDDDLTYGSGDLDRDVVAPDQIRTVLTTFRDRVFSEMFPGRTDLPKTLIFANLSCRKLSRASYEFCTLHSEFCISNGPPPPVEFTESIHRRTLNMPSSDFIAHHSTYIEDFMRHSFIYDVSRLLLLREEPELVTVLRAEVDDAGVDLVMTFRKTTRQIQMKTLARDTTNNPYSVAESLSGILGGCVVWTSYARETLKPTHYHLMGGRGNAPMRDLSQFPQATKKKNGVKVPRAGYRSIKIKDAEFQNQSLEQLVSILFDQT